MGAAQAEVEHLADDVGGLEVEARAGELRRELARGCAACSPRSGACSGFRAMGMSASMAADVVGADEGQVVGRWRHPDVVVDGVELARRDDLPDAILHLRRRACSVSSMRVPIGARKWSCIRPASTVGEEVEPDHERARARWRRRAAPPQASTKPRWVSAALEHPAVAALGSGSKRAVAPGVEAAPTGGLGAVLGRLVLPSAGAPASAPASARADTRPASRSPPTAPAA